MFRVESFSGRVALDVGEGDTITLDGQPFVVEHFQAMGAREPGGNVARLMLRRPRGRKAFVGFLKASGVCLASAVGERAQR